MNFETREVKFSIKDKNQFNAEAIVQALKSRRFPNATVKSGPS